MWPASCWNRWPTSDWNARPDSSESAAKDYGPHKTIYNRFIRWSRLGVFNKILAELSANTGVPDQVMIDATHLKAHRTAASPLKI